MTDFEAKQRRVEVTDDKQQLRVLNNNKGGAVPSVIFSPTGCIPRNLLIFDLLGVLGSRANMGAEFDLLILTFYSTWKNLTGPTYL